MRGKIVMIGSMKGGVSKTVTTFNLAYSLSKLGKKVLAVDFDSQANLSTCLGVENVTAVPVTIGNLMLAQIEEEELPERSEYIQTRNGVDYISSSMVLSAVDAKLRLEMGSEKMLSDILETLRDSYDYILIDTSPSLGALTINAMSAADEVLITVKVPSAGHGLNLQSGGNILVWFGITWSLELYQQTVARLWRQGQTEGTVSVIHIVTDGTVDERILKALEAKDLTQSALIDAVKAEVGDGK